MDIVSQCIQNDMNLVIFGSNIIERAGLDLSETTRLIERIFECQLLWCCMC